ncbi:hypothetical protein Tco_1379875, partial [Tanacetum coccineum]
PTEFDAEVCEFLANHPAPFWNFSESFLCLIGISRYYELDDNVYPVFLVDDDEGGCSLRPVRIGEREVREGEVPLLDSTKGLVVSLADVNEQGNQNDDVEDAGNQNDDVQDARNNRIRFHLLLLRKLRVQEEEESGRRASDSDREGGGRHRFFTYLTLSFITSSVSLTSEREGGGRTDSVTGPNLRTQHPSGRFVVLSDSPCHSSSNIADAEVSSVVRSLVPDPPIMTTTVATTIIADTSSVPVPRAGNEPVHHTLFADSASIGKSHPDVVDMDSETLHQTYVPKWNVTNNSALDDTDVCRGVVHHLAPSVLFSRLHNMEYDQLLIEFNVRAARQTCFSSEVRLWLEHDLKDKKKLEGKCSWHAGLLKEKDAEIASLKAQLSLKEAEVTKAIHLRGQYATVEAAEVARTNELNGLKERKSALEEEKSVLKSKVVALVSVDATKVTELASLTAQTAKLTQDLSELGLSCDELSVKASSLEAERDRLVSQMSFLEGTCFDLHDEVSGYRLFKEQIDVVQDEQVKVISDKVASLDAELIGMALHLDEEFYPRFFTTIAGQRWILGRSLRLMVMKCLQSLEYLAALRGAIGRAIDKGMQDGLAVGIDHGKAKSAVSQKDASIADIMGLLRLDAPAAETPKADQLQPSPEQLILPIHRSEDQVVIEETSLSFSLDVVHSHVQRIRGDAAYQCLSISDTMVPLIESLFAENLVGEDSTSGVSVVVSATTALSTTFAEASSVPPIPVSNYKVADTKAQVGTSSSHKIIFGEETLETLLENPTT